MVSITPDGKPSETEAIVPDTIHIMRGGFQPDQLDQVTAALAEDGYRCATFDGADGMAAALSNPRTLLLLINIATSEAARLIEVIKAHTGVREVPVLVYFSEVPPDNLEHALSTQIADFLLAPLNLRDLRLRVNRLTKRLKGHRDEAEETRRRLFSQLGAQKFIGSAPSFLAVIEKIPRVAACDATALIVGETGTGKELCARAIHYLGSRANKPFVPVNCGSIPPELFENEMFGHEPGAFTDARHSRRGLIAETEGGTLFLDEVDSLPLSVQVKLLRLLQERQYRPLGGQYRKADIRVIAATNQNLQAKLQTGAFREDLFYRLKVVTLHLPRLRDRREDILPLANHFLNASSQEYKRPMKEFSAGAIQKLCAHTWSGNVRELENVVRQAVVLVNGPIIRARDLQLANEFSEPSEMPAGESFKVAKARVIEEFERTYLEETLVGCEGNISKAARRARKDRRSFFALLKKYDLAPNQSGARKAIG